MSEPKQNKPSPFFTNQPLFFNQTKFRQNLKTGKPLVVFKDAIAGANTHFDRRFDEGEDIRALIAERSQFIDLILHYAWHVLQWDYDLCLLAVGGYGRGELHPQSDIDILILLEDDAETKYEENLSTFITFLWDLKLNIGSAVRTVSQCVDIARDDITVATNLTECRRLSGNGAIKDKLETLTAPEYMWPVAKFYQAKFDEQTQRHKKYNFTEYDLEPNIKNSPGGLRDIQTINWIAKRYYKVRTLRQLEGKLFFTELEFGMLRLGEAFLWKVRYGLHRIAGRAEERLLFEYQRALAKHFGFVDNDKGLAVEQFMHQYYRAVQALHDLNEILLQILYERTHETETVKPIVPINERFQLRDDFIEVSHAKVFIDTPSALMEIFVLICQNPKIKGVQAETIRLIRENRYLINDNFRNDPENKRLFIELFKIEKGMVRQLKRMKGYGILGLYIPEFGKITGQMQHDLFHRYTVDAHTLLVMNNIRRLRRKDAYKDFPIAAKIMADIEQPALLYIAALYHDIGKGRGGDHSILGAQDAEIFCESHGLTGTETRFIMWLIQKHLLMSYVSQKKDISDPIVIQDFALQVGDIKHLDYLYVLTVSDMRGTNPNIWNSWRASLMMQLYTETKLALRSGLESTIDQQAIIEETQEKTLLQLKEMGLPEADILELWSDMHDDYFIREDEQDIAWQTEAIIASKDERPLVLIRDTDKQALQGATQLFVRVKDANNVFLATATALAQLRMNIQDARVYNSKKGYTIDTFYILDEDYQPLDKNPELKRMIVDAIMEELKFVDEYSDIVRQRTPRRLKQFATPTRTSIQSNPSASVTILEVVSPNRPGLLATIGRIFLDLGINIHNAKISTLGERVEDIFFITDTNNKPLSDPELCQTLQNNICKELDSQVEKDL